MAITRNITLDILRGIFLCIIIIDHVFRFPNIFEVFTGRGQLWVSAAEGFFLISGILVGILKQSYSKLWKRALFLYLLSVFLTLVFTYLGYQMPSINLKSGLWTGNLGDMIISALILSYSYGWADFLPYYAVFLFFSPLAITLVKKAGPLSVLIVSCVIWILRDNNFFAAWQLLFMIGIIVGHYLPQTENKISGLYKPLVLASIICLLASALWVFKVDPYNLNPIIKYLFDKDTLGPGRVLLSLVSFTALYFFVSKNIIYFKNAIGEFFKYLGRKSLLTYVLHAIVVLPIGALVPYLNNYFFNSAVTALTIIGIYSIIFVISEN